MASRLVYRKGVDLLVQLIPIICERFPKVRFLIAGDGPKRIDLEQMIEQYILEDRVTLVGAVPHSQVRNVLVQGHIFLNTSLTEAFCIAIVEAASCGLLVVSTKVGGVPEVLPDHMILFGETDPQDLVLAVEKSISLIESKTFDANSVHHQVSKMYSWDDVAKRTEKVYEKALQLPQVPLAERFRRYHGVGAVAGKFAVMIIAVNHLLWLVLEWLLPRSEIDLAPRFDLTLFHQEVERLKKKSE